MNMPDGLLAPTTQPIHATRLRNFLRPRSRHHQHVPADCRRLQFLRRTMTVLAILEAA
jgi:hypothetical protein